MRSDLEKREKHCFVCGREFLIYPDWVFKRYRGAGMKVYFCSWKCLRQYEKTNLNKVQRREMMRKLLGEGKSVREIAGILGVDARSVYYWKNKLTREGLL